MAERSRAQCLLMAFYKETIHATGYFGELHGHHHVSVTQNISEHHLNCMVDDGEGG